MASGNITQLQHALNASAGMGCAKMESLSLSLLAFIVIGRGIQTMMAPALCVAKITLGDYQGAFVDCTEALKGTMTPSSVTSTSPKLMQARLAASRTPSTAGGDHIRDVLRAVLFACFLYARKYIIYNIVTATCLYIQKHDAWSRVGKKA